MNCYQAKAGELTRHWYVIDATDMVVGRLAAQIAPILMGKHRPTYTPHIDTGDFVIVTNVDKVVFTGKKWQQKEYQRYSGHPGGQKNEAAWKLFQRRPERILQLAVQRMMPKNKIGRHMLSKLKLYAGPQHPHQAQAPMPLEPLTGRPAPAGIVFAPRPVPKVPRPPKAAAETVAVPGALTEPPGPAETAPPTPALEVPPVETPPVEPVPPPEPAPPGVELPPIDQATPAEPVSPVETPPVESVPDQQVQPVEAPPVAQVAPAEVEAPPIEPAPVAAEAPPTEPAPAVEAPPPAAPPAETPPAEPQVTPEPEPGAE